MWGRFSPFSYAMKVLKVSRGIALLFLGPRHSRWDEGQPLAPATCTPGKDPEPIVRRLGGPQGRSGRAGNLVPTGNRSRIYYM